MPFLGIGNSADTAFKGVFSGNTDAPSTISLIIQDTQEEGTNYYGLFGYLDSSAVVRNLNISTSIGIQAGGTVDSVGDKTGEIYAGGVAGYINNAFLYNVKASASISITSVFSTIYAGGIAGYMKGGLSNVNKSTYDGTATNWIIDNLSNKSNYIGYVSGYSYSAYLKDFEIINTNSNIMLSSNIESNANNYLGAIFGYYDGAQRSSEISNVKLKCEGVSALRSIIHYGDSYVGGAIGYVNATKTLEIGDINFINTSNEKVEFISQSLKDSSHANLYAGGLFAYITGTVNASSEFKTNIKEQTIDGKPVKHG